MSDRLVEPSFLFLNPAGTLSLTTTLLAEENRVHVLVRQHRAQVWPAFERRAQIHQIALISQRR